MNQKEAVLAAGLIVVDSQNVSVRLAEVLGISRQAASAKLSKMKKEGVISTKGLGRGTTYSLVTTAGDTQSFARQGLSEDDVWQRLCAPIFRDLPDNVRGIWHHGITEMVNNAIDHSGSEVITVGISRNILNTVGWVSDAGEGIFLKIQRALGLYDPREAILELAKGKFTTDPANHSGEGIFFSSRMFDRFFIQSGALHFMHEGDEPDISFERNQSDIGTFVFMQLANDSQRTTKEVFDKFALPEDFSFAKTIVPVRLAQHEGEKLVSRSQAKRLTRRFDRFKTVVLNFSGVEEIGQGFADEVFRVFVANHPGIEMIPVEMTPAVEAMVSHVRNAF